MESTQQILTTGQVAKICNVAPRTVTKWFDSGQLRGYRIPGSKDRRIPVPQLVHFLRAHGMPLNGLDSGRTRVLVAEGDERAAGRLAAALAEQERYDVAAASCLFSAGVQAGRFRPHVLVVDLALPGACPQRLGHCLRTLRELEDTRLIATAAGLTAGQRQGLRQQGFEAALDRPFHISDLARAIDDAVAIVS